MEDENLIQYISKTKFNKKIIYSNFEKLFLNESNIIIRNIDNKSKDTWINFTLSFDNRQYNLHIKFKSVTSGGWKNKPQVRRIQISKKHLTNIIDTTQNELTLLAGYVVFKDTPLFCFWNPKRYISHKTTCSCYVNVSSINQAYKDGYYLGYDSGKEVYICNSTNLRRVITEFISNNYINDFKW